MVKRILGHLERTATALTGRVPPSEGTSSASAATEGEGSSPREPHLEPLHDDLPFDDSPPDDLALGDSA